MEFYFIILLSYINDTSAYIFGNIIKGPLIIPKISPKKTWSGTLTSLVLSSIVLIIFTNSIFISILISSFFFLGDIYFSFIKRVNNIKDFSNLIVGHGGVLDRLDSILITSFIYFFYLNLNEF